MEDLTPPLMRTVRELRWRIASGLSMREALRLHLETATGSLAQDMREWWTLKARERDLARPAAFRGHLRGALLETVERGLAGQPVLEPLQALEQEIERAAHDELARHLAALPFRLLIPLLLFQFPAFLILLLGPLLRELGSAMGA